MAKVDVPSMPGFGVVTFVAPGPCSAHAFYLIWQEMFGRLLPSRIERQQKRSDYRPPSPARWLERPAASELTLVELNYAAYPDSLWLRLFTETAIQLPYPVHAALWAPYVDAAGNLPTDISRHVLGTVHPVLLEKTDPEIKAFVLNNLEAGGRAFGWRRQLRAPNLELRCREACWQERDRDDLLHSPEGPAKVWPDGTAVYAWRGMLCPVGWMPRPSLSWLEARPGMPELLPRMIEYRLPTARQALNTGNLEHRRIAIELLGWDTILENLRAVVVDADPDPEIGTLVRVRIPPPMDQPNAISVEQMFLRVRCGTGRRFSLAVPPDMQTARQANAWTYGLDPADYEPEVRT